MYLGIDLEQDLMSILLNVMSSFILRYRYLFLILEEQSLNILILNSVTVGVFFNEKTSIGLGQLCFTYSAVFREGAGQDH